MKTWPIIAAGIISAVAFVSYAALLLSASWPIEDLTIKSAALFGDSFGVLNSFFTGGAFLLILWTIVLQRKELELQRDELKLQRKEMSRVVASHQRELHMDLLKYSLEDEDLAKVWASEVTDRTDMRQTMYVELIFSQWQMNFREDLFDRDTIIWSLSRNMKRSEYFRRYWERASKELLGARAGDAKHREFYELCEAAYQAAIASTTEGDHGESSAAKG